MAFGLGNLKDLFGKKTDGAAGAVGIDIGSSSIKVVQLRDDHGTPTLETYGELQLGPYGGMEVGQPASLDEKRLTEALVDILREASVSSKQAAHAIPYSASFVTVVRLPGVPRDQLASMVPIEARKYVPVPINEVTLDWFVIPEEQNANEHRVLLAAIHNEALRQYQAVLRGAVLASRFSEIEIFSTIRSSVLQGDTNVAVLDLGATTSKLYAVKNGIVLRSHNITSGAQDLTKRIAEGKQISLGEAEEHKRTQGLTGGDGELAAFMTPELDRMLREARLVLTRFEEQSGDQVEKVILTGGGSVLMGIEEYAAGVLQKEVVRAHPFDKVGYPAFLEETLREAGPSFAVALGVALRLLNENG